MIRPTFLETARIGRALVAAPEVRQRWNEPSALPKMTVGALAAHLGRAALTVVSYLASELPEPLPALASPEEYFVTGALTTDIDDELNTGIRDRSIAAAANGRDEVLRVFDEVLVAVDDALTTEPTDRAVAVFGSVMLLDEYLVTRMVELAVHIDDLAVSVGVGTPALPALTVDRVVACLTGMARRRHGDLAVLRALARRERASIAVFPVF